jgi:hypothetical protein
LKVFVDPRVKPGGGGVAVGVNLTVCAQ